ncbi:alpha/beta fold hydrolase [Nocardia sp. NPDC056952]|uniref:alpha/beta fold hydrolase n=1 Tax=Nocardia sp. NPDC056952 TaxID=3345979 RepID=UPI00362689A3
MTTDEFESWRTSGQYIVHRGRRIFVVEGGAGAGRALLCIHGFPTASWDWHGVWPGLCTHFGRVIAPDMVGFGYSAKPRDHPYSIFDQADMHEDLLRAQGIDRYHILAHDYGDTVAQELLARDAERREAGDASLVVESVCLLNGGLFPETHRPRLLQKLLISPLGPLVSAVSNERAFARSLSAVFAPDTIPAEEDLHQFWLLYSNQNGHRNGHRLIRYMSERRQHRERWVGALATARVPIRLIDGLADPISGAHMVERYRDLVPNPDIVELPAIGHYPQVEDPKSTLDAILEFHRRIP